MPEHTTVSIKAAFEIQKRLGEVLAKEFEDAKVAEACLGLCFLIQSLGKLAEKKLKTGYNQMFG